ncbi:PWWP domain [Cinara cedri]|uniref:PWWP domain n=1 Tax=Cinara cedri TaxID=506608 RepID=A0A5E4M5R1_9HEMI|nr:PWWP domain [Cinara cedri]
MDQQDVQHRQTLNKDDTMESKLEYVVGDVVWAKLMGCPFWPAIVTYDPVSRLFFKGENNTFALHVRFCNFYGQRSWVTIVEKYCSEQDLVSKHPDCMVSLKKSKEEMISWHAAVEEADRLMTFNREERLYHLCTLKDSSPIEERGIYGPALGESEVRSSGVYCLDVNECFSPKVRKATYSHVEELRSDHLDLGSDDTRLLLAEIRKSVKEERLLRFCTIYKLDFSKELNINGPSDDPAPQNTNLNSNGVFHNEAAPVIIRNENIQNNDTTDGNESDDSDYSAANALEIADLLLQKYGFSQNDAKPEKDELDFKKLEVSPRNYHLTLELMEKIWAMEEREYRELQIQKQKDELKRCLRY